MKPTPEQVARWLDIERQHVRSLEEARYRGPVHASHWAVALADERDDLRDRLATAERERDEARKMGDRAAELTNLLQHWQECSPPPSKEADSDTTKILKKVDAQPYFDRIWEEVRVSAEAMVEGERARCLAWATDTATSETVRIDCIRSGSPFPKDGTP